ncbi:KAP family P-loop domain protein [filamentous cyanobacterium CCP3]|nr:KAP family P-loop domain protein [filamentous cyanobacterium CCP3]
MDQALLERYQQAYKDLDLFPLVEPEDIERFRVDYGLPVMVRLKREIEASQKDGKFIFAGHRGCGKSTLLKRLAIEVQPNHSVVFFSIADLIEMSGITHVNILYAIALKLLSQATKQRIPVAEDIKQDLLGWNTTERTQTSSQATTGELGLGLDNILNLFTAKLQQEKSFRDELEKTFEKRISDLVGKCDRLAAAIQTATKKPVLVIIDDLDKLDLPLVEDIYRNNIKSLFSPRFRVVFTIPVSAVQEPQVMGALNSEGVVRPHLFPVAKFFPKADCHNPEAEPVAKTFDVFLKVLSKRLPDELVL